MLRTATLILLSVLAAPLFASEASAARDPELVEQKANLKETRKLSKNLTRLDRRWNRAAEHGNDRRMHRLDEKLVPLVRDELTRLREKEVPTRKPPVVHPTKAHLQPEPKPRMESLRDVLVELRDLQPQFDWGTAGRNDIARKAELLADFEENLAERWARQDERYRAARAG